MSDLQTLIEESRKRRGEEVQAPSLVESLEASRLRRAKENYVLARDTTPDEGAEVLDLSARTGLPVGYVKQDTDHVKKAANEPMWADTDSSVIAYMGSKENALVSSDDHGSLSEVAKAWKYTKELGSDIKSSWRYGAANVDIAPLAFRKHIMQEDSAELDAELAELKAGQTIPEEREDVFGYLLTSAAEMSPITLDITKQGLVRGTEGALLAGTIAAVFGQLGPQALTPEELVTVPAAMLSGGAIGFKIGASESAFVLEAGLAADEFAEIIDEEGNHLDPNITRPAAVAVGAVNAALELVSFAALLKTIPGIKDLSTSAVRRLVKQALKDRAVQKALLEVGKRYAGAVTIEGVTEMAQEAMNILGAEISKIYTNVSKHTAFQSIELEEATARIGEAGKKAAAAAIVMSGAGSSASAVVDVRRVKQAKTFKDTLEKAGVLADESKTKERSPVKAEEAFDHMGMDTEAGMAGEDAAKLFQIVPEAMERLGLTIEEVQEAAQNGQDVFFKTSKVLAHLDADERAQVLNHIKAGSESLSVAQAEAVEATETLDQLIEDQAAEQEFQADLQKIRGLAETAGRDKEELDVYMPVLEALSRKHADQGGTPGQALRRMLKGGIERAEFDEAEREASTFIGQIPPDQVMDLDTPLELPVEPEFNIAIGNTPGAEVTAEGLLIDLVRYQKEEQEGAQSIRTGVFYLPTGSPQESYYKKASGVYGGKARFQGKTLLRKPLFTKGGTGGQAVIKAYDVLKGKNAYETMRKEVLSTVTGWGKKPTEADIAVLLEKYGAEGNLAFDILSNSGEGNTLAYAIQENIAAHAVREAGYDSVVGWSSGKKRGNFISEVFDVRETTYPSVVVDPQVHPTFEKQEDKDQSILDTDYAKEDPGPTYDSPKGAVPIGDKNVTYRETAVPEDKTVGRSLRHDLALRRRGSLLANAIAEDFEIAGVSAIIGKEIKSPNDLATAAQVYRNPSYETLRYIIIKDNKVIDNISVSSRLPGVTLSYPGIGKADSKVFVEEMKGRLAEADGYYMVHNHPGGDTSPSTEDISLTGQVAVTFGQDKYLGHVIINHGEYSVTTSPTQPDWRVRAIPTTAEDVLKVPSKPHAVLGQKIHKVEDLVYLAQFINSPEDTVLLLSQSKGGVRGAMVVSESEIQGSRMPAIIRRFAKQTGANQLFAVVNSLEDEALEQQAIKSIEQGFFTDVVDRNGRGLHDEGNLAKKGMAFGRALTGERVVREPGADPLDQLSKGAISYGLGQRAKISDPGAAPADETVMPESSPYNKQELFQLVKTEATVAQNRHKDVTRIFEVPVNPEELSFLPDGSTEKLIMTPAEARQANTAAGRQTDWKVLYDRAERMTKFDEVKKVGAQKLEGINVVSLTKGCQRIQTLLERIENGLMPNETLLEACWGGDCWVNLTMRALIYAQKTFENMEIRDLLLADPAEFNTWLERKTTRDFLTAAPFIRQGQQGDDSHLFATDIARAWMEALDNFKIKTPNVFISAGYAPVTDEQYAATAKYAGQFELHLSNGGWFSQNEIMLRLGEFEAARAAGLNAQIRLVTNRDNISGVSMANEAFLYNMMEELRVQQYEVLETPFHDDEIRTKGLRRSNPTGEWKYICCETGKCKSCANKCMTKVDDRASVEADLQVKDELFQTNQSPIGFFSPLRRAVELIEAKAMPAKDWINRLKKTPGVKQEEADWTGLYDWLGAMEGKATRDQILAFLDANGVQVEEVVKGQYKTEDMAVQVIQDETTGMWQWKDDTTTSSFYDTEAEAIEARNQQLDVLTRHGIETITDTKYSDYQLPGGEDYSELLLMLPVNRGQNLDEFSVKYYGKPYDELTHKEIAKLQTEWFNPPEQFSSVHWDEGNVLAHVRLNSHEVNGEKVLFLEELQSDWALEGRRKGFRGALTVEVSEDSDFDFQFIDSEGVVVEHFNGPREVAEARARVISSVPAAPFVTSNAWQNLVLKRMLRYAAENGFARVAWITGEQTAERYSLDKKIEGIGYRKRGELFNVHISGVSGAGTIYQNQSASVEDLENVVGKEITKRMIENQGKETGAVGAGDMWLTGDDLKIEASWARNLYDKAIPNFMNKFGKKYGVGVEDIKLGDIVRSVEEIDTEMDAILKQLPKPADETPRSMDLIWRFYPDLKTRHQALQEERNRASEPQIATQLSLPVTTEMQEEIMGKGLPLFQGVQEPRGSLLAGTDDYLIKLFGKANKSTLLHETAHIFLREIRDLVVSGSASQEMIRDWSQIQQWLGVDFSQGLTIPQEEQFARGFEAYLMEGKAPSRELEGSFARYRRWLVEIYRSVKGLNVQLTDEIRGVFDRMLATDEQIDLYSEEIGLKVRTQKEMDALGLGEEDKAYLKKVVQGVKDRAKVEHQQAKDRRQAEMLKEWNQEAKDQMAEEQVHRLRAELSAKGRGLDIEIIRGEYGQDMVDAVNAKRMGMIQRDGQEPIAVAEEYEYESVKAMLDDLVQSVSRETRVQQIVQEKQVAHDGNFEPDGPVLDNPDLEEYLENMGKYIGKALGREEKLTSRVIKKYVDQKLAAMPLRDALRTDRFLAAMQRAMKKERESTSKGDFETALTANRQARVNFHFARKVNALWKETESLKRKATRVAKNKGSIAPDYLENLKALLSRYGLVKVGPVDPAKMPSLEKLIGTDEYVEDRPEFSGWLFNTADSRDYRDLSVEEIKELSNLTKYLEHLGREEAAGQGAMLTGLGVTLEDAVTQTSQPMANLKSKKKIKQADRLKKIKGWFRSYSAANRMFLFLMQAADSFANVGPKGVAGANETLIYDSLLASERTKTELKTEAGVKLNNALEAFSKRLDNRDFPRTLDTDVPVPENMQREGTEWTFERVLAMALNMGTEYNRNAVLDGFGLSDTQLNSLLNELTDTDWDAIQNIWDVVNSYWPQQAEVYERRNGFRPGKVEANVFTTPTGKVLRGGYYPLRFDENLDARTQEREEVNITKHTANAAFAPAASAGHMKQRQGTGALPVKLSLGVLSQHIDYVSTYIAYAETIRDVSRIFSHETYRREFERVFGKEFYRGPTSLRRLLKDIVGAEREQMNAFDRAVNTARNMATRYILGVNVSVALKQAYSLPGYINEVGAPVYKRGLLHTAVNPVRAYKDMVKLSPAMRERASRIDRDTMSALESDHRKATRIRDALNFLLIHTVDGITVTPAWWGMYLQGMDKFAGDQLKAVAHADKSIASGQPFNRVIDMSLHQRSHKGGHVLFTMFSSFTMKYGNRVWLYNEGRKQGQIDWVPFLRHIAYERILPPFLMHMMFASLWGEEPEWEDVGLDILLYQFIGLPFFRDLTVAAAASYRYSKGKGYKREVGSPVFTAVEIAERLIASVFQWMDDLDNPKTRERAEWAVYDALSFTTGAPVSRVARKVKKGMEQIEKGEGGLGAYIGVPNYNIRRDD